MASPRIVLIGLDGADHELVTRWMDSGRLPTLARLRSKGASGRLITPPGLGDDAAWSTFATGVLPGEHGRFHHRAIQAGTYDPVPFQRDNTDAPPFWEALDDAGLKVAVLDMPKAPVGRVTNGTVLADWMPHGRDHDDAVVASPESFATIVSNQFAMDPQFDCDDVERTPEGYAALTDALLERLALRTSLTRSFVADPNWDLVLSVVAETHCIGHQCWHLTDTTHESHDARTREAIGDPVERVYAAADSCLDSMMHDAGPEATVIVFSVLGMGPNYSGNHLLGEILERLDPVAAPAPAALDTASNSLEDEISRWRQEILRARRFFAVVEDMPTAGIRLNLVGREPHGTVDPTEYESTLASLEEGLRELRDEADGRPAIKDLIRTADTYPGPHSDAFADLLVVWRPRPLHAVRSSRVGAVRFRPPPDRSGNHRPGGWFLARGPHIDGDFPTGPLALTELTAAVRALALKG